MSDEAPPGPRFLLVRDNWARALREGAVIAASVLAALGAQAWWERAEERDREQAHLALLLADVRQNETLLAAAIRDDSLAQLALLDVLRGLYGPAPRVPDDSIVALIKSRGRAFSGGDFQLVTGAFRAVTSSGELRLIRSDSVRTAVLRYLGRTEHESEMIRFTFGQSFGDPTRIGAAFPHLLANVTPGLDASALADGPPDRRRLAPVLLSVRLANLNRLSHLRSLQEETARTESVLEAGQRR